MAKLLPFPSFGGPSPEVHFEGPEDSGVAFSVRLPRIDYLAENTVRIASIAHQPEQPRVMQIPPLVEVEHPVINREYIERAAAEVGGIAATGAEKVDDHIAALTDRAKALAEKGDTRGILPS